MELKRKMSFPNLVCGVLLIVPYGIETTLNGKPFFDICLLIVPYGIETKNAKG